MGPNGAGKTTLIETLAGRRELAAGKLSTGHNVNVGYLSQHADELGAGGDRSQSVVQATQRDTGLNQGKARALLGRFLFSGEDADKPLEGLSGGERRRLSLAVLVNSAANVLILDEPTNHLDIESREALEDALRSFAGAILLVSHDRALLDAVGTRTVAIENRSLHSYTGGWPEYVRVRDERRAGGEGPPRASREAAGSGHGRAERERTGEGQAGQAQAEGTVEECSERAAAGRAHGRGCRGRDACARGRAGRSGGVGHPIRVGQVPCASHSRPEGRGGGIYTFGGAPRLT